MTKSWSLVVAGLGALIASAHAIQTKSGNVSGQTWTADTYWVSGSLTVNNGTTLTLEPGVVVKFAPGTGASVYGTISAQGTEADPIVITSRDDDDHGEAAPGSDGQPQPGDWSGITCYGYSGNAGVGHFTRCLLRHGGASAGTVDANLYFQFSDAGSFVESTSELSQTAGVRSYACSPVLTASALRGNGTHGLHGADGGTPLVTGCAFDDNGQYGAWLSNIDPGSSGGNQGDGNGTNGFGLSGTVAGSPVWSANAPGFPYVLIGTVTVPNGETLRLEPGVTVKGSATGEIYSNGTLVFAGTADSLVTVTSLKDDTVEGDSNGDGSATQPAPGDWRGIRCYGYSGYLGIGDFDWCRLRYGGSTATTYDANLAFEYSDSGHFINSASEYSQSAGLVALEAAPTVTASQFTGSLGHGLSSTAGTAPLVTGCAFTGNGGHGAWLSSVNLRSYGGNSGSGNGVNGFGVAGTINADQVWAPNAPGFPYVLAGTVMVDNGRSLSLLPGVTVKAAAAGEIYSLGTLVLAGTADSLVTVTSLKDDTVEGDSNGDGSATQPAPGDWRGIRCYGYSGYLGIGDFDWCRLRYGGSTATTYDANLAFEFSDSGHFINSASEYSQGAGLWTSEATPTVTASQFTGSLGHGLSSTAGTAPAVTGCVFTGNGGHGAWLNAVNLRSYGGNSGSGNGINGFGVAGTISADQVWAANAPGFPYVLTGIIHVNNGRSLTLLPGVTVKAAAAGEVYSLGTLVLAGNADSLVTVTSLKDDTVEGDSNGDGSTTQPAPGDWRGIRCYGYSGNLGIGNVDWCRLRYGGATASTIGANLAFEYSDSGHFANSASEYSQVAGLRAYESLPVVSASHFSGSLGHGITATSGSAPVVSGCTFTGNGGHGAWFSGVDLSPCGGNSGSGNGINGFGVAGTVAASQSWTANAPGFPYVLTGTLTVNNGSTLTLEAGVVVKGAAASLLQVNGSLNAAGTAESSVRFTSLRDDAWDGDTNMDGSATQPAGGDWRGIYCYGYSGNLGQGLFNHCGIRYGGGGTNQAGLYYYGSAGSSFLNGSVEFSGQHGLRIGYGGAPVVGGSHIADNAGYGVFIEGGTPVLGSQDGSAGGLNRFLGNNGSNFQVWNQSGTTVQACYNDWGFYTSEVIDTHIRDNEEGGAANLVLFEPFVPNPLVPWIYRITSDSVASQLTLHWMPVAGATGYRVYSSTLGYDGFAPDNSGSFSGNSWTAPLPGLKRYYLVRAILPDEEALSR